MIFRLLFGIIFLQLCAISTQAQNLVPNGDFESYSVLPTTYSQIYYLLGGWNAANGCVPGNPSCGTPDFYHTDGFHATPAAGGKAYVGVFSSYSQVGNPANYREYVSIALNPWMEKDSVYLVSFFIRPYKIYTHTTYSNNMGVHINKGFPVQYDVQPITTEEPQFNIDEVIDQEEWVQYRFLFKPDTFYRSITLGNFFADTNTIVVPGGGPQNHSAYYLIDSVQAFTFNYDPQVSGDTVICAGEPIALTASGDIAYQWLNAAAPGVIIDTNSVLQVAPDSTTTYLLYSTFDTISYTVTVLPATSINLGNDTTMCVGDTILLSTGNAAYSITWHDGDTNHNRLITAAGIYTAMLTDSNSCSFDDQISINTINCDTVGVYSPTVDILSIKVYPNPSSGGGWFIDHLGAEVVELRLYNNSGQLIYHTQPDINVSKPFHLDVSAKPGVYYLQVVGAESSGVVKVVKTI